jgi:hypothetical protein
MVGRLVELRHLCRADKFAAVSGKRLLARDRLAFAEVCRNPSLTSHIHE